MMSHSATENEECEEIRWVQFNNVESYYHDIYYNELSNSHRVVKKQRIKYNKPLTSPRALVTKPNCPWQEPKWVHWIQADIYQHITSIQPLPQPNRYGSEPYSK